MSSRRSVSIRPGGRLAAASRGRLVELWSATATVPARLDGHVSDIRALAFSEDGRQLLTADARVLPSAEGRVDVLRWDLDAEPPALLTPRPEAPRLSGIWAAFADLPALRDTPWPVAFDDVGKTLARRGAARDQVVRIEVIDAQSGRVRATLATDFKHDVLALALSVEGTRLAAAVADGRYELWDVVGGRRLLQGRSATSRSCQALALSRDGMRLAVACGTTLTVHRMDQQGEAVTLTGHPASISALAFDPAGRRLAIAHHAEGWLLWDLEAARTVCGRFPAPDVIESLAYARDGRRLASGGRAGRVIDWNVALDDWTERACLIAGRDMSPEEWQRYLPTRAPRSTCLNAVVVAR